MAMAGHEGPNLTLRVHPEIAKALKTASPCSWMNWSKPRANTSSSSPTPHCTGSSTTSTSGLRGKSGTEPTHARHSAKWKDRDDARLGKNGTVQNGSLFLRPAINTYLSDTREVNGEQGGVVKSLEKNWTET